MSLIYSLFGLLDYAVYSIAAVLVRVIKLISTAEIFNSVQITNIVNKVYVIVGVLMLFKLVISAIQYMVNPDSFDDKEKGLAGILKKTIISIALIVLTPAIFDFARDLQEPIIAALPEIILSNDDGNSNESKINEENVGNKVAFEVLKSFVSIKTEDKNGNKVNYTDNIGFSNDNDNNNDNNNKFDNFRKHIADGCSFFDDGSKCYYNYMIIISTLCGGFLVYVLLSLVLDVAIRTIKFEIIRILAPIPISSYIYKKDSLNKFVKTASQVYADLFIRMAIIYFIIFAIQSIFNSDIFKANYGDDWFMSLVVRVSLIFGLLMFAKNAPKFLSELLGLPDIGAGDFKDMFTPAWQRAGGFGAVGGMITAAAGNAINKAKFMDWEGKSVGQKLKNVAKVAGSGIAGATSAGFHGGIAAMQGKNVKDVNAAGYKRAIRARQNRDLDKLNGVTPMDRARVRMGDMLGIDTKASLAENKQKAYSTLHSDVGAYKKAVMGRIVKNGDVSIRTTVAANSALDQLGRLLNDNMATINASGNRDLINFANKFELKTDANGNNAWALKANESLSYHDIAAINADAVQSGIGSIAGVTGENGALTLLAQKELFTDAMHGRVMRTNGTAMDEINVNSGSTHVDISTVFQAANQHLAENAVQLGESAESLQAWFSGTSDPTSPHYGKDFNNMDDTYQKESAKLSGEMSTGSTGREAAARASLDRRNANKEKK